MQLHMKQRRGLPSQCHPAFVSSASLGGSDSDSRAANQSAGFTLLEITFAILILAGSLTVLLGLQSSSVQRTIRDQHKQQAMLMARQILAAVESAREPPDVGSSSGTAREIFEKTLQGREPDRRQDSPADLYQADLVVEKWQLPGIDADIIRRLRLTLSWSDNPLDSLAVYYFFAPQPNEEE